MNRVTLTGRLTSPPTTRNTTSGSTVTSLRVAIPRPRKDGADQGADFVDVTVFGHQAETCATYLTKGRRIAVDGQLHHSEWDSENGRRQKLEVIARNVEFLDRANDSTDDTEPADGPEPEVAATI
jgi:single-strand DNA-binding protein